jgi:alpha-ketoglutarate-dependent taurine dioxygenase
MIAVTPLLKTMETPTKFELFDGGDASLDTVERGALLAAFRRTGFVVLRHFDATLSTFESFTRSIGGTFLVHGNPDRDRVNLEDTTQRVQPGKFAIPLHIERGSVPFTPDVYWFYCARPASAAGETVFCDGIALCEELDPTVRRLLETKRIRWKNRFPPQVWQRAYPVRSPQEAENILRILTKGMDGVTFAFSDDDLLSLDFCTAAIRRPRYSDRFAFASSILLRDAVAPLYSAEFEDGSAIPDAVLTEVARAGSERELPWQWEASDILMIDNTRVLHGRRAFDDDDRDIYVRMSCVHFD